MESGIGRSGAPLPDLGPVSQREFVIGPTENFQARMAAILGGAEPPSATSPVLVSVLMRRSAESIGAATLSNVAWTTIDFHHTRATGTMTLIGSANVTIRHAVAASITLISGTGRFDIENSRDVGVTVGGGLNQPLKIWNTSVTASVNAFQAGGPTELLSAYVSGRVSTASGVAGELLIANTIIAGSHSDPGLLVRSGWTVNVIGGSISNAGSGPDIRVESGGICRVWGCKYDTVDGVVGSPQPTGFYGTLGGAFEVTPYSGQQFVLDPEGSPVDVGFSGTFPHGHQVRFVCASLAAGSSLVIDPGGLGAVVQSPDGIRLGEARVLYDAVAGEWFQVG